MNLQLPRGRERLGVWNEHAHIATFQWIPNKDLLHSTQGTCYMAAWTRGEFGGRTDTCVGMAEFLCYSPETIAILIDCTPK